MNPPGQLIEDFRILEPPNPWLIYYWVGGVLLALLVVALIWIILRRRLRYHARVSARQVRAAQEDALAALKELFALVAEEKGRPYAIESSAIIRRYIERRFAIRAPMRSTEEFLHEAQHARELAAPHQDSLGVYLRHCDFLKFARGLATRPELEELHAAAVNFVTETRYLAEAQP